MRGTGASLEAAPPGAEAPAVDGDVVGANPTLVSNVETLAAVVPILGRGAEWHRSLGTPESAGVGICTVVGDVQHAGVAEIELGESLRSVIDRVGGGPHPGRSVKAVLSGVSTGAVHGRDLDVAVSYEALDAVGSGLGSLGFIVYDDTTDMVAVARMASRFLFVESCGQCPACKFGTGEVTAYLDRIATNQGVDHDIEMIEARLTSVVDANRCYLGTEEQRIVGSLLAKFPEDFVAHLEGAPAAERIPVPKIVDIADGVATYDARQMRKRPDWTYAD